LRIGELRRTLDMLPAAAFTATAYAELKPRSSRSFLTEPRQRLLRGFDRPIIPSGFLLAKTARGAADLNFCPRA